MNTTIPVATTAAPSRTELDITTISEFEHEFISWLSERFFGQPEAFNVAVRAFRRSLNPLRNKGNKKKRKPIYTWIAAGESRTGKTLLPELLAEFFHGNPEALVFINGSDYMERHQLINLVGAPKSYLGHVSRKERDAAPLSDDEKDDVAELSNHNLTRSRMGSKSEVTIILVDEWEKACREFNRVMLRILDKGKLTLSNGEEVDFSNCIIVFTTNLGTAEVEEENRKRANPMGFNQGGKGKALSQKEIEGIVVEHMRKFAPPEFRNRIKENGEVVVYRSLSEADKFKVLDRDIRDVQDLISSDPNLIFTLTVDEAARKFLMGEAMKDGGNVSMLKGLVGQHLEAPLTGELIKRTVGFGDRVEVTRLEGKEVLTFIKVKGGSMLLGMGAVPILGGASADTNGGGAPTAETSPEGAAQAGDGKIVTTVRQPRFALVPGIPVAGGVLIDMSELMFLMRATDVKAQAAVQSKLMAPYTIELSNKDNLDALTVVTLELVREVTELLGVKVKRSSTSFEQPYTVKIDVLALPGQLQLIKLRYPAVKITSSDGSDPSIIG